MRPVDLLERNLSVRAPLDLLLREPTLPALLTPRLPLPSVSSLSLLLSDRRLLLCSAAARSRLCFPSRQLSLCSPLIIRICWS